MCRELSRHRDWLWTFLETDGVEPTNNAAERSLRHAVIWRKLSFGTQSENDSRFVETLLSAIETCRQQNKHVLTSATEAVQAHFAKQTRPLSHHQGVNGYRRNAPCNGVRILLTCDPPLGPIQFSTVA